MASFEHSSASPAGSCSTRREMTRWPALQTQTQAASVQQAQPSRRAEIAELYTRYGATVLSRCRWILKDDEASKDAAQEVFVKVMRSIDGFRNDASPLTWILRIATNHCL